MTITESPLAAIDAGALADAIDPAAELAYRRQLAAEAYQRGREDAYGAGYAAAAADVKAAHHGLYNYLVSKSERGRWIVRDQYRTRASFSQPHPDDYPGKAGAA